MDQIPVTVQPSAPKILIVDDEPDILAVLKVKLEKNGFEVFTASDGVEGMYRAFAVQPDVIILDIMMPRMDGTEVCARLTNSAVTRGIPIIFLSALENKADEERREKQPGSPRFILAKPFSMSRILERISELLNRRGLLPA